MALGCFRGTLRPRLSDEDPSSKIPAIKRSVEQNDLLAAQVLVKDLDSDDPAVRFYAIEGLRRLTGETHGYNYYEDETQRRPAVEKWKRWLADESMGVSSSEPLPAPTTQSATPPATQPTTAPTTPPANSPAK